MYRKILFGTLALSLVFVATTGTGVADLTDAGDSFESETCPACLEGDGADDGTTTTDTPNLPSGGTCLGSSAREALVCP